MKRCHAGRGVLKSTNPSNLDDHWNGQWVGGDLLVIARGAKISKRCELWRMAISVFFWLNWWDPATGHDRVETKFRRYRDGVDVCLQMCLGSHQCRVPSISSPQKTRTHVPPCSLVEPLAFLWRQIAKQVEVYIAILRDSFGSCHGLGAECASILGIFQPLANFFLCNVNSANDGHSCRWCRVTSHNHRSC